MDHLYLAQVLKQRGLVPDESSELLLMNHQHEHHDFSPRELANMLDKKVFISGVVESVNVQTGRVNVKLSDSVQTVKASGNVKYVGKDGMSDAARDETTYNVALWKLENELQMNNCNIVQDPKTGERLFVDTKGFLRWLPPGNRITVRLPKTTDEVSPRKPSAKHPLFSIYEDDTSANNDAFAVRRSKSRAKQALAKLDANILAQEPTQRHRAHHSNAANARRKSKTEKSKTTEKQGPKIAQDGEIIYRGVSRKGPKYQARIRVNGHLKYLGMFEDPMEAARVYDEAALKFHGSKAIINFPDHDD